MFFIAITCQNLRQYSSVKIITRTQEFAHKIMHRDELSSFTDFITVLFIRK